MLFTSQAIPPLAEPTSDRTTEPSPYASQPPPLDWHRIEHALVAVARAYGYSCDTIEASGDKIARDATSMIPDTDNYDHLNLTEFAKDLARELGI